MSIASRLSARWHDALFAVRWFRGTVVANPVVYLYPGVGQSHALVSPALRAAHLQAVTLRTLNGLITRQALVVAPAAADWLADNCRGRFRPCFSVDWCLHLIEFSRKSDAAMFMLAFPDAASSELQGLLWLEPNAVLPLTIVRK